MTISKLKGIVQYITNQLYDLAYNKKSISTPKPLQHSLHLPLNPNRLHIIMRRQQLFILRLAVPVIAQEQHALILF